MEKATSQINNQTFNEDINYTLSDLGNSERFSAHYDKVCQYVPEMNLWRVYDGKVWNDDDNLVQMRWYGSLIVRKIYSEASMYDNQTEREIIARHALKSESAERIKAMITLLPSQFGMTKRIHEWDRDKFLLNVNNGTIDLRTGQIREHKREDFITTLIKVDYNKDAECPLWHKFLDRATGNNQELKDYLQKAVGYSLTGDTRKQLFFFVYGLGNNGKSVFTSTIRRLLGEVAIRVSTDLFMVRDKSGNSSHKEGLANLRSKRLVIASELEEGKQMSVSIIKDLTGGETIRADRKYSHEIEFQPECKLWLVGNHKPTIKDTTLSIWRRVKLIPFTTTIPTEEIDELLTEKLEAEYPGILAWAVGGCLAWQQFDLTEPRVIVTATKDYREDQDILSDFIEDCCLLDSTKSIIKGDLKTIYNDWCKDNNTEPVSRWTFKNRLMEKGITEGRIGKYRYWKGIDSKGENTE